MVSKNAVSAPGGPVSNVDKPAIQAKPSDSAVSTAAVTPLAGSSVHPNVNGNVQPTSSKTTAPALKMGSPPVKGIRPVTNRRNIALPVEVYSTFLYVDKDKVPSSTLFEGSSNLPHEADNVRPWACRISVANGYSLMKHLTQTPQHIERFRFESKTSTWYMILKTEKMFHCVVQWLEERCNYEKLTFVDNTSPWKDTSAVTHINIHTGYETASSTTEVLWCSIHGECYFIREIAKSYGGSFQWANKAWDGVALEAIPILLKECFKIGIPLMGNFNHDGSHTAYLAERGAYIDCGMYRWGLHSIVTSCDYGED